MKEQTIEINGRRFFYRSQGKGPAVALLHGFGEDGSIWQKQYDAFANYQLLIPDLPGSSASEPVDDMSMEGQAALLKEWLDEIGVQQVAMIGHSMGGYITLAFAERFTNRLKGIGLFHSTAHADTEEKKETRRKGIAFIQQHGASAFLETMISNLYGPVTREKYVERIKQHLAKAANFSATALVSYYKAMMARPDRTAVLRNSHVPVLIIAGKEDSVIPLEDSLSLAHLPSLSYIHVLKQSGHMGMVEEEEESSRLLKDFLDSLENDARPE
jgi:pimeloyl-ACP methyl ester carboxylesterase